MIFANLLYAFLCFSANMNEKNVNMNKKEVKKDATRRILFYFFLQILFLKVEVGFYDEEDFLRVKRSLTFFLRLAADEL